MARTTFAIEGLSEVRRSAAAGAGALLGAIYTCERCDRGDPMDQADLWINGQLNPPGLLKQTDPRWP